MITLAFPQMIAATRPDYPRLAKCIAMGCDATRVTGASASSCDEVPGAVRDRLEETLGTLGEDTAAVLHHVRGWSQFSNRDLVLSALRDGVPEALETTGCGFVARLMKDALHPSFGEGHFFLADWLVRPRQLALLSNLPRLAGFQRRAWWWGCSCVSPSPLPPPLGSAGGPLSEGDGRSGRRPARLLSAGQREWDAPPGPARERSRKHYTAAQVLQGLFDPARASYFAGGRSGGGGGCGG